jgi:hypothetical protein
VRRSQKCGVVVTAELFDDELVKGIAAVNNESRMRQRRRTSTMARVWMRSERITNHLSTGVTSYVRTWTAS